jgi:hypothetical protein
MAEYETEGKKAVSWECPNPREKPYNLWELVALLETDKTFAQFFSNLLKAANENDPNAIACMDSYFAPTTEELQAIGISASQVANMRRCTDSGLLVAVIAKENARK